MNASPEKNSRDDRAVDVCLTPGFTAGVGKPFVSICLGLVIVTALVYLPVRNFEFVHYDDDDYVTNNQNVQQGLCWQGIKWAFTTGHASNWHPLTWLSHILDCSLFGDNAGWHHLVNVLFHTINTLLLFIVFARMTRQLWPSAFIAALFALHPLHVESVAWVAERKDVLSTFFWMLTMLAYVRYVERANVQRYLLTLLLFALGLMAKPMLVTLPFVLLLLDYWPLNRFLNSKLSILNLLLEKIPFLVLSVASSIVTFIVQQKGGAVPSFAALSLADRLPNAVVSYLAYLDKMVWPSRLAALYPHPAGGIPAMKVAFSVTVLAFLTVLFLYYSRKYRYLAVGWLWYLGTLVPVIGVIQVGAQAMADRYTYVPLIGIFVIIAFGAADLAVTARIHKTALAVAAAFILAACAILTSIQVRYWQDSFSLFDHTLAVTKDNYIMHNNYGNILNDLGRPAEAVFHFQQALRSLGDSGEVHNNIGNALQKLGKLDEAIEHYNVAIKLDPKLLLAHYNLGLALAAKGQYDQAIEKYKIYIGPEIDTLAAGSDNNEAIARYEQALRHKPLSVEVISNLGYALANQGNDKDAVRYYYTALKIDPNDIITHGRLALTLAATGEIDKAVEQCRIVLAASPNDVEMHTNLGILLQIQGKFDEAIDSYKKALEIDPAFQKARDNLNAALARKQTQE